MSASISVPLYCVAHGRAGDKGNRSNISVIAYHPLLWDTLVDQVTEQRVEHQFAHRQPSLVKRYLLPRLHAMNFVLDDVLEGGVTNALNLDAHGKALSFLLLDLKIEVDVELVRYLLNPPRLAETARRAEPV
jgi:hypothetical protein